ncbi:MAG: ribonuclease [Novosphingobium sp.]
MSIDWFVEEGIGEQRAIRVENGRITAARLYWPGSLAAGQIEDAQLIARHVGSSRGTARFASGEDALVSSLPRNASEGAMLRLSVTRAGLAERGRSKLAQARPTDAPLRAAPSLAEAISDSGARAKVVRTFPVPGWDEIMADALSGSVAFNGGTLYLSPTPAMILIDIDGSLSPRELALAAVPAITDTIARLDIAGSIGIDFPTLDRKEDRRAVDTELAAGLGGWAHERTAMNGFGFVQLVARMERPSILHLLTHNRAGAAARLLLRRAEQVQDPGVLLLTCHPALRAHLRTKWLEELTRRSGREVRIEENPALALEVGFAQAIAP